MTGFDAVLRIVQGVDPAELQRWIEERWVMPERGAGGYDFQEVDIARLRLIVSLRRELAVDEQGIPVVLHLLDQVYALRHRLKALCAALEGQPPEIRQAVMSSLEAIEKA